jgi:iron uptake system component EfeO
VNHRLVAAVGLTVLVPIAGCTSNSPGGSGGAGPAALTVESTDSGCHVSHTQAPSGNVVFKVTNSGNEVTEFYVLADDGLRIIGEVENIGPGITRDLVVQLGPGTYVTACKPGMVGDGIRARFTVTDSGTDVHQPNGVKELVDKATSQYAAYVRDQAEQLLTGTKLFARRYVAGHDDRARAVFAATRMHWERIEPVAESFGDVDPRLDLREADLAKGQKWTGWHRIEKDLWPPVHQPYAPATGPQREVLASRLVSDTQRLYDRTRHITFTADQLGNGAKELLDEVATGKVTGEEEIWSHTDLWDFQANIDGARIAFETLRPVLEVKDHELATTLEQRFASLQELLDRYRRGSGWVLYTSLTDAQVRQLSDSVNALGEPLSELTAAVVL